MALCLEEAHLVRSLHRDNDWCSAVQSPLVRAVQGVLSSQSCRLPRRHRAQDDPHR